MITPSRLSRVGAWRTSHRVGGKRASGTDGDARRREVRLRLAHAKRAVVEDRRRERRVGAGLQRLGEVLERAGPARRDDRDADRLG